MDMAQCPLSFQALRKQRATGRSRDGGTFPLSIAIKPVEEQNSCVGQGKLRMTRLVDYFTSSPEHNFLINM